MKIKLLIFTIMFASLYAIYGCGSNVAPAGATITANPSTITASDTVDPYVDQSIQTLVTYSSSSSSSSSSSVPMNGIKVTYSGALAVGQQFTNTGFFAFIDDSGNICPSPCTNTTNSNGVSTIKVRFCTTVACEDVTNIPLPSGYIGLPAATPLTYTTNIYVSSGSATPASISVSIN